MHHQPGQFELLGVFRYVFVVGDHGDAAGQNGFIINGPLNRISGNSASGNHRNGITTVGGYGVKNEITKNTAMYNDGFDLYEANSTCDNDWVDNLFGRANKSCIH